MIAALTAVWSFLKSYWYVFAILFAVWFIYHKGEVAADNRAKAVEVARKAEELRINATISTALRQQMEDLDKRFVAEREKQAAIAAEVRSNIEKEIAHDPHLSQPGAVPRSVLDQLNRIH